MFRKLWPLVLILGLLACRAGEKVSNAQPGKLAPDAAAQPSDLSIEQLTARYAAARGGEAKLRAVQAVRMSGTLTTREVAAGPITLLVTPGHYLRRIVQGADSTMLDVVDGDTAWQVSPRNGIARPTPMQPQDAMRFRHLADPQSALIDAPAKGNKLVAVGKLSWRDTRLYKIEVTFRDGGVQYVYLDEKTFLPVRMVSSLYVPPLGRDIQVEVVYGDFRAVDGVQWPFSERGNAPEVDFKQSIAWERIEVDPALPPAAFTMPKG